MRRDDAIAILQAHRGDLQRFHVKSIAIFGSVARNEARPDSDVDLLVDFDGSPVSLFDFVELREYLQDILGRPVDLVQRGAVKRQLRERIYGEAIDAA
jgi:uncharacterized protein